MDSRGSNSSNSNNSNRTSDSGRRSSKDRGIGKGGRVSPSDYYYGSGATGDFASTQGQGLYTNNNDYSKYNSGQSDFNQYSEHNDYQKYSENYSPGSDYGHYADSPHGDYGSSPYDVNCSRQDCSRDNTHSLSGDCTQCQGGYDSPCNYGDCSNYNCNYNCDCDCSQYGACQEPEQPPTSVQVTAKVLFGSVGAISNLKQKKGSKK